MKLKGMVMRPKPTNASAIRKSRRRALSLIAGATALGPLNLIPKSAAAPEPVRWNGVALGARSSLVLLHPDQVHARRSVAMVVREVQRLESIFSLYRQDSAINELNREGILAHPPLELVELLHKAALWSEWSVGAFDVTVQPLWDLYTHHFQSANADPEGPSPHAIEQAAALVDYNAVEFDSHRVRLGRPSMSITLNGIAQGYITDRLWYILREEGFRDLLLDMGEIRGHGQSPAGGPWRVGFKDAVRAPQASKPIELRDRAIATSQTNGTTFEPEGRYHHLFDPKSGRPQGRDRSVSVIARNAVNADACTTALLAANVNLPYGDLISAGLIEQVLFT